MKLIGSEDAWSIGLECTEEAQALLAVQATAVGNQVLSTTDPTYDRITPGIRAIELLRFAEIVLPSEGSVVADDSPKIVEFPLQESQHLSGLLYGATRIARTTGTPVTKHADRLFQMEDEIETFFGMNN